MEIQCEDAFAFLPERADGWRLEGHPERLAAWLELHAGALWMPSVARRVIQAFPDPGAALASGMRAGPAGRRARGEAAGGVTGGPAGGRGEDLVRRCREIGATVVTAFDEAYPRRLLRLAQAHENVGPPVLLYVRGALPEVPCVAIVGARRADAYGLRMARQLARDLAGAGVCVVSGLARGVDAAAHRGALKAGGLTVAVLGAGMDRTYPPEHEGLAAAVAAQGAVLSEFPLGFRPRKETFPLRNRVIAALASAVVVVEAGERSGSLVTARHALELGVAVGAVPGDVDRALSRGSNALLADGAATVTGAEDVLRMLDERDRARLGADPRSAGEAAGATEPPALRRMADPSATAVYRAVTSRPQSVDALAERTGLTVPAALVALSRLELAGLVERTEAGYARSPWE